MLIIFHMNTRSTQDKRRWDKFHLLGDYLIEKGHEVWMTGSIEDWEYNNEVKHKMKWGLFVHNMAGGTNLAQLKDLLKRCDLLISVNTFIMHLGVYLEVPMVAIVGATDPKVILPDNIARVYSEYAKDISLESVIDEIERMDIMRNVSRNSGDMLSSVADNRRAGRDEQTERGGICDSNKTSTRTPRISGTCILSARP